jgi:transposase
VFVKQSKRPNGRVYLSIAHGYRENGVQKTRNVESLGYLDDLERLYDDPLAHFKAVCDQRNEEVAKANASQTITIHPAQKIDKRTTNRKNIGCAIPLAYYNSCGIETVLRNSARTRRFKFDVNAVMRLLVVERLFNPGSKRAALANKDNYFFRSDFTEDDMCRTLDFFAAHKDKIIATMNNRISQTIGRNMTNVFYDVTNVHFERDKADEDIIDEETGDIIEHGLIKYGKAKNNIRHPIVQIGLLQDSEAIPITYRKFPGNTNDCETMLPVLKDLKRDYGLERVVVVADKGLNSSDNIVANTLDKNGFVFSQSICGTKSDKKTRDWVLSDAGYMVNEDQTFKIKSREQDKIVTIVNDSGKKVKEAIEIKIVAFWSRKYAERSCALREQAVQRAKKLIANPKAYSKATSYGAAKYVNNITFDKKTGAILEDTGKQAVLNDALITEEEKCDGYYCIITSEVKLSDAEIIETYKGLWRIEEAFKILKSEYQLRPMHVWSDSHIEAHCLLCYIALTITRLMQKDLGFAHTAHALMDDLAAMSGTNEEDNWWLFDHRTDLTDELCANVGIDLTRKRMKLSDIKTVLSQVRHGKNTSN